MRYRKKPVEIDAVEEATMTENAGFVTVTVEQSRESWQALLDKEGLIERSYTPLGVAWSNLMQAIRDALGEN